MPRRLALALAATLLLAALPAVPAQALKSVPCRKAAGFRCAVLPVPLDRSGRVAGTVRLHVAVEAPRRGANGFLVALSGGPGQPSVPFADSFRSSLAPALGHRRLVILDQRGTGASGALDCKPLQALGALSVIGTHLVESCAEQLGPRRQFYATADTVEDIDAVRQALHAPKVELMGVSYGTYVAEQYARIHPDHTDGLILDSVVPADDIDPYFLDTYRRLPRILREQCARGRCAGATKDPLADLAALARRLSARPVHGRVPGPGGALHGAAMHDESELLLTIMTGDLNPFMQAALPGAIHAAVHGDPAELLRLRHLADGPPTPASEFSSMLNEVTTCADVALPYTFDDPFGARWYAWRHANDGVPDSAFAPFSRASMVDTSVAHDCLRWPQGDHMTRPSLAPLPDVPAIILSGRLDTRTPLENARELLPTLPHGQLLTVGGTGHDVLDSDITGCAALALRRWADGRPIGTPCRGKSNAVAVTPAPPRALAAYRSAPGVGGARGRVVYAVLDTIADAQLTALQTLYAGFMPLKGGGLRAGSFRASSDGQHVRLHGYELVPGVRVTGALDTEGIHARGIVRVDGPGALDGVLRLNGLGGVTGLLGGRALTVRQPHDARAAATRAGRVPVSLRLPALAAAVRRSRLAPAPRG